MQPEPDIVRLDDRRAVSPDAFNWSDAGNAERLIARHGDEILYCHPWSRWLIFDGCRWKIDDTGDIVRRAKETVREMHLAAVAEGAREFAKFALKSEGDRAVRAMLTLAQSGRPVLPEQLDVDPWTLNCLNGTLDLRTGELHAHDRAQLLTKLAPIAYDPEAAAPTWLAFLERIMDGRTPMIDYLAKAVGYSLTGSTREQVLFLLHGAGANGKSTLVETLRAALGDYAMQSPAQTLLDRREGVPNDIARLRGARLVSAIETGEGRRLAEAMVKQMTGGDMIPARFMRAEWFEFKPEFKLWLATNHLPTVRGTDEAIWRRIHLIPFTVTIPEGERDGELPQKLLAELPGIFAWAVAGCAAWQADDRLERPDDVRDATADYRADSDVLGDWIASNCIVRDDIRGLAKTLYADYRHWSDERGEKPLTQTSFGRRLSERGFDKSRGAGGSWWRNRISLRHGDESNTQVTSYPEPDAADDTPTGDELVPSDELVTSSPRSASHARTPEVNGENPSQLDTRHLEPETAEEGAECDMRLRAREGSRKDGELAFLRCTEPACEFSCNTERRLRVHLETVHFLTAEQGS